MHGGYIIFAYKIVRFAGCLALQGLSLATLILEENGRIEDLIFNTSKNHWGKKHRKYRHPKYNGFTGAEWLQVSLCFATVCPSYTSCQEQV